MMRVMKVMEVMEVMEAMEVMEVMEGHGRSLKVIEGHSMSLQDDDSKFKQTSFLAGAASPTRRSKC